MIEWIQQHQLEAIVLFANAIVNGLRMAYLEEASRPRWVQFALGFVDPFALNFWSPIKRAAGK